MTLRHDHNHFEAASKFFGTHELLERTLSYLSSLELVRASLVSKTFYSLIATSPTLRRKLFLLPNPAKATSYCELRVLGMDIHSSRKYLKPLPSVNGVLKGYRRPTPHVQPDGNLLVRSKTVRIAVLCPLLDTDHHEAIWYNRAPITTLYVRPVGIVTAPVHPSPRLAKVSGKWRNMFLCNPPAKGAVVKLFWEYWNAKRIWMKVITSRYVSEPNGLTVGGLIDSASTTRGEVTQAMASYVSEDRSEVPTWRSEHYAATTAREIMDSLWEDGRWIVGRETRIALDRRVIPVEEERERLYHGGQQLVFPVVRHGFFE
jgi:hypothetical protein